MTQVVRVNPYFFKGFLESSKKRRERNACTVVALHSVTGNSFDSCFEYMKLFGRKHRKGMLREDWGKALESMASFKVKQGEYSKNNRITVKQFIDKHPEGKYYVASRGHAYAIIDGVLWDHSTMLRRQITCAYRVYSQEDLILLRKGRDKGE